MKSEFARAMSRATDLLRAQDVAEATATIRAALAGRPPEAAGAASGAFRIAPDAEDVEPVAPERTPERTPDPTTARRPAGRRRLGEVVDLIRAGRTALDGLDLRLPGGAGRPPAPPLPEGARFAWRSHATAAGTRRYRLFVPSCATSELQGLVVMLHGCKQDPDDFAAGTGMNALAEARRLVVAYPEQTGTANASRCWNWFEPAHQRRGSGEPAELAALARALVAEFDLPADRAFVAGLSAGGAMAAVLGEAYPDLFAAVGIHSGLACGSASDAVSAFAAMRGQGTPPPRRHPQPERLARVIVFHGTADHVVHPGNAEAIANAARADGPGRAVTLRGGEGARTWSRTRVGDAGAAPRVELWLLDGAGHAWSGGDPAGSFTDPLGPSASAEMLRFFLAKTA